MLKMFDVHKSFHVRGGIHPALRGVSLEVPTGQVFGIVGESGAGKSTLVRCLALLERPEKGQIWLGDTNLSELGPQALRAHRQKVGLVFQHFNLLRSASVRQNIALPLVLRGVCREEIEKRVTETLAWVGLESLGDRYPEALSGGQKQRVGIARALIGKPSLLLLDEATSALDPLATASILALVREIQTRTRITTVLITHEMDVVSSLCDQVAVLSAGQIAEFGPVAEVFLRPQSAAGRALLASQKPSGPAPVLIDNYRKRAHAAPGLHELIIVTAEGAAVDSGGLFQAAREAPARLNLLAGGIHRIGHVPYGRLVVELSGTAQERANLKVILRAQNFGISDISAEEKLEFS